MKGWSTFFSVFGWLMLFLSLFTVLSLSIPLILGAFSVTISLFFMHSLCACLHKQSVKQDRIIDLLERKI